MKYYINRNMVSELNHFWEMCIGSCHAATALREDYRIQLKQVHEELGFQYVRFHGLFDDDMSVVLYDSFSPYVPSDKLKYNFMNVDNVFDYLLSIGMKPFIELGFMPKLLASGETTTFAYNGNITPPKDYKLWSHFIESFVSHMQERYGDEEVEKWFFEVWNEPNLESFWTGTKEEYFNLYKYTARAIKNINNAYRVGGPATSINAWIPEFKEYCSRENVPLDFISTHHYPTDDPMWNNPDLDLMNFLSQMGQDAMNKYDMHIMQKMTKQAKEQTGELPLYYTEWNVSAIMGDPEHDTNYAAATIARILHENIGLVEGYSWWTFSDIFEEMGQMVGEFQGGFGLMTYHGIKKPSYWVYQFMHELGNEMYEVISEEKKKACTVGILATKITNGYSVLAYNQNTKAQNEINEETVTLSFDDSEVKKATICYIDETNCNPLRIWQLEGEEQYPNNELIKKIQEKSECKKMQVNIVNNHGNKEIKFVMQPYSVALIKIER